MNTEINTPEQAQANLYQLMSWLSPAFPVGAYAYSHGLEFAIECGEVGDRGELVTWLQGILAFGGAASDARLLRAAWSGVHDVDAESLVWAAEMARAFRGSAELALESAAQGKAFITTVKAVWPGVMPQAMLQQTGLDPDDLAYPVAVGVACAGAAIPLSQALTAYLHGFAANAVSAAVRLIPLGQTDGQHALAAALAAAARTLSSAAVTVDWTSMQHETQYTRLFRS